MRVFARILLAAIVVAVAAAAGLLYTASRDEIAAVARPDPAAFAADAVAQGARLAAIGNCNVCHTAAGGAAFAGGRPFATPFGTIYSTNITPDVDTGIGAWSEAAFIRSMREGVDREGNRLYPAFPYDHFTLVSDDDNRALYAYLMTRPAVRGDPPPNDLPFPFDQRSLLAGWNLLFFDGGTFQPDASQDAVWNRGRYLAEGLGHCGACHTPRNALGAEDPARHFAGAELDGWHAYALDEDSPAAVPWTVDALAFYLRNGWHAEHGVSRGTMAPVTANLAAASEDDVRAIATYVVARMGGAAGGAAPRGEPHPSQSASSGDSLVAVAVPGGGGAGAAIYAAACGACHDAGRPLPEGGLSLSLSSGIHGPNAQNLINVVLYGLPAPEGEAGPIMPGFAGTFSEDQLVALADYAREAFSDKPAWNDTRARVRDTLTGTTRVSHHRSDGEGGRAPASLGEVEVTW